MRTSAKTTPLYTFIAMPQQPDLQPLSREDRVILAIQAIKSDASITQRQVAALYDVGESTIRRPGGSHPNGYKPSKRQHTTDDEEDVACSPEDPKKPTFMVMKATGEDVDAAFGRDVEGNHAILSHTFAMMATKTLPIRDASIVDSGCAQHVCNNASKFVQMDK
ncbi:hypothetical protein BKA66DRAFT_567224 [Pyrenochaeta sp. MPI-SDFR-AT-0127]|nr:hypothetical protein BKA66DRAFT_567224 [Pyrenochaeta sp. MPI-SDFR-AT-0127]